MPARPAVLVTRKMPDAVTQRLQRDYAPDLNPQDNPLSQEEILARAGKTEALLVSPGDKIDAGLIARLPRSIRAIATFSVGYDHIDVEAAKRHGFTVTNTPGVLTDATADLTMLLLLGAARRAHDGEEAVRKATWTSWSPTYMLGTHVTGKRLAIFGMGRIGQAVAQRARGFDMQIHYSDLRRVPAEDAKGAVFHEDAEEMLQQAAFLTLHCNLTPETHHWLNERRIARMPDGAIVVNAARGPIVDDEALIAALKSGKLAAAGLDVFENEPNIHPGYRDLPNTFLLPHLGSATLETRNAMGFTALDNLDAVFAGREPPNRVV